MTPTRSFTSSGQDYRCLDLRRLAGPALARLPFCLRVLLENHRRSFPLPQERADDPLVAELLALGGGATPEPLTLSLKATRVVLPDSSGLPLLMDLAALRAAVARVPGADPATVRSQIPLDLVVDHSLTVSVAGRADALLLNMRREFEQNAERYRFFKWAQGAFPELSVVPPGMGIIHQVHLERLARVVDRQETDEGTLVFPEFVLGCDSHTPMVNALGLLAWGVGGIEAEAAMLGLPYGVTVERVVGVRLLGRLREGVTTTDLVLTLTRALRRRRVVGAFVEFCGPGLETLSVAERATLANMAPEYGATVGFFPLDAATLTYLRATGRAAAQVALVEDHGRASGLFREAGDPEPAFAERLEIDLDAVEPCVAGPRRPQDLVPLGEVPARFRRALAETRAAGGFAVADAAERRAVTLEAGERSLAHGAIAVAAITSCTNTSNPGLMLAAGLLASNAVARGLAVPPGVKTSLAPGSRVVSAYLEKAGLQAALDALGFNLVGYGCTTCSGKSGPLAPPVQAALEDGELVGVAVLSGNRNFEGRIHRLVRANYLCSPPLVVAYALAGRIDHDFAAEPLGHDGEGRPVFLADLWPDRAEVERLLSEVADDPALFAATYRDLFAGTAEWRALEAPRGALFPWSADSTYILEPPFFAGPAAGEGALPDSIEGARVLCRFGDALTTDHITPAGEIAPESEAGLYLRGLGVAPRDFNAVTQRRGNHEVMARVTFANGRIRNLLGDELAGGETLLLPEGERLSVHAAAERYRARGEAMVVLAGRDYGMGSSRDWAAKGPALLGVRAVIALSFERIHRSNLIGMGILPLVPESAADLERLDGRERFSFTGIHRALAGDGRVAVRAVAAGGKGHAIPCRLAVYGAEERDLLARGGIFPAVYRAALAAATAGPDSETRSSGSLP